MIWAMGSSGMAQAGTMTVLHKAVPTSTSLAKQAFMLARILSKFIKVKHLDGFFDASHNKELRSCC
jgi:hypothetical protein